MAGVVFFGVVVVDVRVVDGEHTVDHGPGEEDTGNGYGEVEEQAGFFGFGGEHEEEDHEHAGEAGDDDQYEYHEAAAVFLSGVGADFFGGAVEEDVEALGSEDEGEGVPEDHGAEEGGDGVVFYEEEDDGAGEEGEEDAFDGVEVGEEVGDGGAVV